MQQVSALSRIVGDVDVVGEILNVIPESIELCCEVRAEVIEERAELVHLALD